MSEEKKIELEIPLPFAFYRGVDPAMIFAIPRHRRMMLSEEDKKYLRVFGSTIRPISLSKWDERRWELNLEADCGCIEEDVQACFETWESADKKDKDPRAVFCINKHFHYEVTDIDISELLLELLVFLEYYDYNNSIYSLDFIQKRYHLSYEECMTMLAYLDRERYLSHGSALRCPFLGSKGQEFLKKYSEAEIQAIKDRLQLAEPSIKWNNE